MSENISIKWDDNFLGVAYRYFDVRMNIALMFSERKEASKLWLETVNWWNDHTIKVRFVEIGDDYWFIVGADSRKPATNKSFYKILPKSQHYERFKKGHEGSAILRFSVYSKKSWVCCLHSCQKAFRSKRDSTQENAKGKVKLCAHRVPRLRIQPY